VTEHMVPYMKKASCKAIQWCNSHKRLVVSESEDTTSPISIKVNETNVQ
jgi:hypothetical protein